MCEPTPVTRCVEGLRSRTRWHTLPKLRQLIIFNKPPTCGFSLDFLGYLGYLFTSNLDGRLEKKPVRSSFRFTTALCISLSLASSASWVRAGSCGDEEAIEAKEIDAPSQKEYREEYDRDATNQKKQTWDQYWGWVKSFHEGTFFVSGWTDRAKNLVGGVKPGPQRKKLVKEINAFGKDLCKEWAKDGSVCKVGTTDLTRWGKMVEKAKKADAGDGEELGKTIASIRDEYKKKVKPPEETPSQEG